MRFLVLAGLVLAPVLGFVSSATAEEPPGDYVQVRTYADQDVYHAGQLARIAVELRIVPRVHVNSNAPDDEFAIPTSLTWTFVPEGVELTPPTWPAPKRVAFEFTDGRKIPVYEGRQRVFLSARLPAGAAPGPLKLRGRLRAQGCTEVACYAPQSDDVKLTLRVVPPSEEPVKVNEAKFPAEGES